VSEGWHLIDLLHWEPPGYCEHLGGSLYGVRGQTRTFEVDTKTGTCTCGGRSKGESAVPCAHLRTLQEAYPSLPRRCPACNGRGAEKRDWKQIRMDRWEEGTPCAECGGTGKMERDTYSAWTKKRKEQ
jgi:DnaJ-class molecular chaperone